MKIIRFNKKYLPRLQDMFERSAGFPLPDVTTPLYVVRGIVVDESGIVLGAGFIKLQAEAVIVIEPNLRMVDKLAVVEKLHNVGIRAAMKKGLDGLNAFIFDMPIFANFLKNRLGYKRIEGEPLSLRF